MTILVTGAGGFVGGHLLRHLAESESRLIGWHRRRGGPPAGTRGVEWQAVDLLDRDAVSRALEHARPDTIYHLAGWAHVATSWEKTLETYEGNVLATHHLFHAVREHAPAARVLVACSATVYAPQPHPLTEDDPLLPTSPYATSKLAQEMLAIEACVNDGLSTLIARSFNHTGPGQDPSYVASGIARQIARIEAGGQEPVLRVGNLEPKRDLTDVRDVVRAYVAMVERAKPGVPYNVCSGRHMTIRTLLETFVARAARPIEIVQDPGLFRPNDIPMLIGVHDRLTRDTGWTARIPLEQTVEDSLDFWRSRTTS
jgi:GDP-4-dehydro-6-deoxy-D-mannose reductase